VSKRIKTAFYRTHNDKRHSNSY